MITLGTAEPTCIPWAPVLSPCNAHILKMSMLHLEGWGNQPEEGTKINLYFLIGSPISSASVQTHTLGALCLWREMGQRGLKWRGYDSVLCHCCQIHLLLTYFSSIFPVMTPVLPFPPSPHLQLVPATKKINMSTV